MMKLEDTFIVIVKDNLYRYRKRKADVPEYLGPVHPHDVTTDEIEQSRLLKEFFKNR
jgi:hypothetical protein